MLKLTDLYQASDSMKSSSTEMSESDFKTSSFLAINVYSKREENLWLIVWRAAQHIHRALQFSGIVVAFIVASLIIQSLFECY